MSRITETEVENFALELLEDQGYRFVSPEELGRTQTDSVIDDETLRQQVQLLNPQVPDNH